MAALATPAERLDLLGSDRVHKPQKARNAPAAARFLRPRQRVIDLRAASTQALAFAPPRAAAPAGRGARAQREAKRRQRVIAFDDMLFNLHDRLMHGDPHLLAGELEDVSPPR